MNQTGLENRAGELMKDLEELLLASRAARRRESKAKLAIEGAKSDMEQLQARLYVSFSQDASIDWNSPNPVLDADGNAMVEFEAQWRTMLMNTLIQEDLDFVSLASKLDDAQKENYTAQHESLSTMTDIGVKKAELRTIAALLEVAGES
jgi:hypothetical protein